MIEPPPPWLPSSLAIHGDCDLPVDRRMELIPRDLIDAVSTAEPHTKALCAVRNAVLSTLLAPTPDFRILNRTKHDRMDYDVVFTKGGIKVMNTVEPIRDMGSG